MMPVSSSTYYCCTVQPGDAALSTQKLPRVASRGREVSKSIQRPFRGYCSSMWQSRTRHRARRSTRDPLFRGFVWGCGSTPCPGQDAEEYGPLAASASSNFCPGVVERFAAFGDEFAGLIGQLCGDGERDRMRHDDVTFSHSSRSTYTAGMMMIGLAVVVADAAMLDTTP